MSAEVLCNWCFPLIMIRLTRTEIWVSDCEGLCMDYEREMI